MAFLELKDIRKSYFLGKEEFPVLKGIDLDFELVSLFQSLENLVVVSQR